MKKIAIVGAGKYGCEIACIINNINDIQREWEFIGFFDDAENLKNTENHYGKVLGTIEDLNNISEKIAVIIAIGNTRSIQSIVGRIDNPNVYFPNIIHPSVLFLDKKNVRIGKGNIISAYTIVSCNVEIGDFNILNTRVTLGHDSGIGSYNVFSPNVQISGSVKVGNANTFGFNSGVIQNCTIGYNNKFGVGAILLRNANNGDNYMGNPAIKMKF